MWEMGAADPVLEMEERCACSDLLNSEGEETWPDPEPGRSGGVGGR